MNKNIVIVLVGGLVAVGVVGVVLASGGFSVSGSVSLSGISPEEGKVGTEIVLTGRNLNAVTTVLLEPRDGEGIGVLSEGLFSVSDNGRELVFTFPGSLSHEDCRPQPSEKPCPEIAVLTERGEYDVSVLASDFSESKALTFTLTGTTDEEGEPSSDDLAVVFADALFDTAVELNSGLMPIEGFTPDMLVGILAGLENRHFAGVEAEQGVYRYNASTGRLVFELTSEDPRHSAAEAVSSDGYATLFDAVQKEYNVTVDERSEVQPFIDRYLAVKVGGGAGGLSFRVSTDKGVYSRNETVKITITASNESSREKKLDWSSGCQSSYKLGSFDSLEGRMCTMALTSIRIPANSSQSWNHVHDLSKNPIEQGVHDLVGRVDGYGSAQTRITIN
ncbi:MAG: BsuPI-related putative proteinase inhibitor [Candidatus Paceibacterota bacterium]